MTSKTHITNYSPFGVLLQNREFTSAKYRYGFNGQEKDDEVKGSGNSYFFEARIYDTRLGRWLSLDPHQNRYPSHSPYTFALNNPIYYIDPNGKDVVPSPGFLSQPQLKLMFETMQCTDIYIELTSNFENNPNEHLAFVYGRTGAAVAETFYYRNEERNTEIFNVMPFHGIGFTKLEVTLGEGGPLYGEYTYSQTYLSGVLAHELIHANLDRYFEAKADVCQMETNFPGISDYVDKYGFTEQAQHEYMAANMRSTIATGMKQFDEQSGTKREDQWYDAASWSGLTHNEDGTETEAWKNYKSTATEEEINYTEGVLNSEEVKGKMVKKE